MAGEEGKDEWTPKTRDDWTGIFKDAFKNANNEMRSEQEEEAAKKAASEAAQSDDKSGKGGNGDAPKRKSFGERLLGL
jgi:Sec-independent protein translocase protein TatA